jgi:hypothetical protein
LQHSHEVGIHDVLIRMLYKGTMDQFDKFAWYRLAVTEVIRDWRRMMAWSFRAQTLSIAHAPVTLVFHLGPSKQVGHLNVEESVVNAEQADSSVLE